MVGKTREFLKGLSQSPEYRTLVTGYVSGFGDLHNYRAAVTAMIEDFRRRGYAAIEDSAHRQAAQSNKPPAAMEPTIKHNKEKLDEAIDRETGKFIPIWAQLGVEVGV